MKRHHYGLPDEAFVRGDIPMTKKEVRMLALLQAHIEEDSCVVDIGAGTGSFAVEAALAAPKGQVFAIERVPEGVALIKANRQRQGLRNLQVLQGEAPGALQEVPPCDVVFIGGSGGHLAEILNGCDRLLKPGGRLVLTAVTADTLQEALSLCEGRPGYGALEAFGVQATRLRKAGRSHLFQALNQVFIIACQKKEE